MTFILVAVEQELEPKDLPGFRLDYTAVGKINAAVKTLAVIKEFSPSLIINYGTAGRLNETVSGLVEVSRFVQRDMDATALGFELGRTPFDDVAEIDFGDHGYS